MASAYGRAHLSQFARLRYSARVKKQQSTWEPSKGSLSPRPPTRHRLPARFARPRQTRDGTPPAKPAGFPRGCLARTDIDLVRLVNSAG